MRPFALFLALTVTLAAVAPPVQAEKTEWSETATVKTKTVYDDDGKLVFQANWDKKTGEKVGTDLDLRAGATPAKAKAKEPEPDLWKDSVRKSGDLTFITADTLVKIAILDELDTRRTRRGESFRYKVVTPLRYGGRTLLAAGRTGSGQVLESRHRGGFGQSGRLKLGFGVVHTEGRQPVRLTVSPRAAEQNKREGNAIAASVGGLLLLGPIGAVGGLFVKGRDITIPAGQSLWVATEKEVDVSAELSAK